MRYSNEVELCEDHPNGYWVMAMMATTTQQRFGPFTTREVAQACIVTLAARIDVHVAQIVIRDPAED